MKYTAGYVAAILVANLGFSYLPMIDLPGGRFCAHVVPCRDCFCAA